MAAKRDLNRRFLGHEALEGRHLLAGIVGEAVASAFQNPLDAYDLNADGSVTAADALAAINSLNGGAAGDLAASFAPPSLDGVVREAVSDFLDATGDGHLTAADALAVINTINSKIPGGPIRNLPLAEDQGGDRDTAATLAFGRNFARALGTIDPSGDVDVFRVTPTKTQLSVSIFSARGVPLSVSIQAAGDEPLKSVETEADSRRPAKMNVTVDAGKEYFITVQAAAAAEAGATGIYGLGVFNYGPEQFRPVTDAELGDDRHLADNPTELPLENRHAHVRSNLDFAGDVDSFAIENAATGLLMVSARADFPVEITVEPLEASLLSLTARRLVVGVTAGTTYVVSVKAADGASSVGPYSLEIVNLPPAEIVPPDRDHALEMLFTRLDDDSSNTLSKDEVKPGLPLTKIPVLDQIFNNWDADKDGQLNFTEFEAGFENLHQRAVVDHPVRDFVNRLRRR